MSINDLPIELLIHISKYLENGFFKEPFRSLMKDPNIMEQMINDSSWTDQDFIDYIMPSNMVEQLETRYLFPVNDKTRDKWFLSLIQIPDEIYPETIRKWISLDPDIISDDRAKTLTREEIIEAINIPFEYKPEYLNWEVNRNLVKYYKKYIQPDISKVSDEKLRNFLVKLVQNIVNYYITFDTHHDYFLREEGFDIDEKNIVKENGELISFQYKIISTYTIKSFKRMMIKDGFFALIDWGLPKKTYLSIDKRNNKLKIQDTPDVSWRLKGNQLIYLNKQEFLVDDNTPTKIFLINAKT